MEKLEGNLPPKNVPVYSTVRKEGNSVFVIDQNITFHTKFNSEYAQVCPFKGNLLTEYD